MTKKMIHERKIKKALEQLKRDYDYYKSKSKKHQIIGKITAFEYALGIRDDYRTFRRTIK